MWSFVSYTSYTSSPIIGFFSNTKFKSLSPRKPNRYKIVLNRLHEKRSFTKCHLFCFILPDNKKKMSTWKFKLLTPIKSSCRRIALYPVYWWWWLFPRLRELCRRVRRFLPRLHMFCVSGDQLAYTNFRWCFCCYCCCCFAWISPQWLSEPRRPWSNGPWRVACGLVSLIGSHTIPGRHSQSTPTLLGHGCMRV